VINNKKNFGITQIQLTLTGHWLVGTHAGRLKAPKNDFCRSCRDEEEEETVEHLLLSSPMQTQTETLRKSLHRRSYRCAGD